MSHFTTPCFVRVENPQERKELIEWMESIGYSCLSRSGTAIIAFGNFGQCAGVPHERLSSHLTIAKRDCGTNTHLFRALAAMNDHNDNYQWFYDATGAKLSPNVGSVMNYNHVGKVAGWGGVRKATAEEIINHFKAKDHE